MSSDGGAFLAWETVFADRSISTDTNYCKVSKPGYHEGYRYLRGMFVCFDAARDQWKLQLMTESENSDFSLTLSKLQLMNFRHAPLVKKNSID